MLTGLCSEVIILLDHRYHPSFSHSCVTSPPQSDYFLHSFFFFYSKLKNMFEASHAVSSKSQERPLSFCLSLLQPAFSISAVISLISQSENCPNKKKMCHGTLSKCNMPCDCISFRSTEAAGNGEIGIFGHCHRSGKMPLL